MSAIEFATNRSNNWFVVSYDWNQCQSILAEARKLGIIPSAPKKYTHPNTRWIIYFNNGVSDQFMKWVRTTFNVRNVERIVGAMRSEAALKHENVTYCQRANISRYSLNEVKSAMIATIGTPAEIRGLFGSYNIKIVGVAGLPQCLQLIEELDKFDEICAELRKPKATVSVYIPEITEDPFEGDDAEYALYRELQKQDEMAEWCDTQSFSPKLLPPFIETIEGEIVDEDEIEINTEEFINALVGAYMNQPALPAGIDEETLPIDFDPHTVEELNQRSVTKKLIIQICADHGINIDKKTQRLNKLDLINHILPALNAAALAAHLA